MTQKQLRKELYKKLNKYKNNSILRGYINYLKEPREDYLSILNAPRADIKALKELVENILENEKKVLDKDKTM